jgi:hypothetical protein
MNLLPNATPLESRFFVEMAKKCQRCAVLNLESNFSISASLQAFDVIVSNNYSIISDKIGFTMEDKALISSN